MAVSAYYHAKPVRVGKTDGPVVRTAPQDCLDSAHDPRMWGCHKGDMRSEHVQMRPTFTSILKSVMDCSA